MRHAAEMLIKHEAQPHAILASRPLAECFISCKARARQCFNYFKEFPQQATYVTQLATYTESAGSVSYAN